MESVVKVTNTYDSMIKSAEAYEAHGLYDEALVLYKNIIAEVSDLDDDVRKRLQYKIEELSSEIEDKDQEVPHDLSSEEVTHIKTGLSIGESAP